MRPVRMLAAAAAASLLLGLPAVGVTTAGAQTEPDPSAAAEQDLRRQSDGKVTVRRDARGIVHFVGTESGKPARRPGDVPANASAERKAAAHLKRYGALWALHHRGAGVRPMRAHEGAGTPSVVKFQQTLGGVPVFGGELAVAVDSAGNLQSVSGETTPLELPSQELAVTAADAQRTAVAVAARTHDVQAVTLRAGTAEPFAYDPALLGPSAKPGLAQVWQVEVTGPAHIRHLVLVDRARGNVLLHYNRVAEADRVVCDRNNVRDTTDSMPDCVTTGAARVEGGSDTAVADVNYAYHYAGHTASLFEQIGVANLTEMIGSDNGSEAGGKRLRSTVRYCDSAGPCPYPNAFWNGRGMFYGADFARGDDVVAHELTHGVTEKTANLAYWYQAGAINESMSDVFGELMDLTNGTDHGTPQPWLLGEDVPGGAVRSMINPPAMGDPDKMTSTFYHAANWTDSDFDNGGVHGNSGVGNKAAYLIAEPGTRSFNGQSITGLGYVKTGKIYYQALTMLTSGADYLDLYGVLPQACTNLTSVAGSGITSADCTTVSQAVLATEMNKQPNSANAKAPEANVGCTTDQKRNLFTDNFDRAQLGSSWAITANWWLPVTGYAKSGTTGLYGIESPDAPVNTYARVAKTFTIPSGVKTYLRFDHHYLLAHDPGGEAYSGARLEYSTNGTSWSSAMGLTWDSVGAVPTTITPYSASGTAGTPYKGFGGDSRGYVASRVDLSSLAGKNVQLRWRLASDPEFALDGWILDNVTLYACGGATPSEARSVSSVGDAGKATVKWTAPLWPGTGGLTKYKVTVTWSSSSKTLDNISPTATSKLVTGLSSGVTYTFKLTPYSSTGAGPSVSKKLIGTKVTATASPTSIRSGSSSKISGKAYRADTGSGYSGWTVKLQGRKKGSTTWSTITSKTTGSGGAYYFTVKPTSTWEYRVMHTSGNTTYMGAFSPIRVVTVS